MRWLAAAACHDMRDGPAPRRAPGNLRALMDKSALPGGSTARARRSSSTGTRSSIWSDGSATGGLSSLRVPKAAASATYTNAAHRRQRGQRRGL